MTRSSTPKRRRPFTLWQEVAVAYAAPALSAGAGGLITGQHDLLVAAFTSIGLTSAVVAALVGGWLQRTGTRRRLWTSPPRGVITIGMGLFAAAIAAAVGWFAGGWLPAHSALPNATWLTQLRLNLPLSAALAASIVTWRWRGSRRPV